MRLLLNKALTAIPKKRYINTYVEYIKGGISPMYTDFGYIGKTDGIEYATVEEALEANPNN